MAFNHSSACVEISLGTRTLIVTIQTFTPTGNMGPLNTLMSDVPRLQPFLLLGLIFVYLTWKLFLPKTRVHVVGLSSVDTAFEKTTKIPHLRHFRIPFNIPFVDGLIAMFRVRREGVRVLEEWVSQYGGIIQGSFGSIKAYGISDPAMLQKVLQSSNPLHLNKPKYLYEKIFVEWFREGIFNSDHGLWHGRRKMVGRAFTYRSLQTYLKFMNHHSRNLVQELWDQCSNEEFQVSGDLVWKSVYFHAVKIIGQIAMGADRFSDEETSNFYQDFVSMKKIVTERLFNPQLLIPIYWHFHPLKTQYTRIRNNCQAFLDKMIGTYRQEFEQRKFASEDQKDNKIIDDDKNNVGEKPFRCLMEEMLQCGATNDEICSEFATLVVAGHETVATTLQFTLLHLALNPVHLKKCQEEVDRLMKSKTSMNPRDGDLISDFDTILDMDDLSSLDYLKRCIMETLRITPAAPVFARRLDAPLEVSDNLILPGDSTIIVCPWVSHRDPEEFPDPEKFDPDRFLPDNVKKRHPFSYIPFSAGPRNCIGYKLAMMEMKVVMAMLLYHFDIYTTDKLDSVKLFFEVSLLPERNYNVILKRRE